MTKLCIGLLTYCNSATHPERYEILQACLTGLKAIANENMYIYALDNGSSQDVINALKSSPYIQDVYQSRNNLYDVLALNFLVRKGEEINAKYVMHLEDDMLFYDTGFIDPCIEFLENNSDCGYVRILKYDFNDKAKYDKLADHPEKDTANHQRHYNNVSKENLMWSKKMRFGKFDFYKNNWHWYNFPSICRIDVLKKILPKSDCYPLQPFEGDLMKNYHDLNLRTGIMDKGVVTHIGAPNEKTSLRLFFANPNSHDPKKQFPLIKIENIEDEIGFLL